MLIIKRELVPQELIVLAKEPMNARQMDGSFIKYTKVILGSYIKLEDNCKTEKYNAPVIYIALFELKVDIFIGLRFLTQDSRSVTILINHMTLSRKTIQTPIIGLGEI